MTPRAIVCALVALAVIVLAAVVVGHYGADTSAAEDDSMARQRVQVALDYRRARARVDTVSRDVVRYATRYETLRDTIDVHDTVQVAAALAVADTTIHACRLLVSTCATALQHADELRALDSTRFRLALASQRAASRRRLITWLPLAAVAGAALLHFGAR